MMTPARARLLRIGALVLVMLALIIVGEVTGLRHRFSIAKLRAFTIGAGAVGVLAYVALFVIGELLHVPGTIFVAAGVAIWGRGWGALLAWITALVSVTTCFFIGRLIAGQALAVPANRWLRRAMDHLDSRPIRTVAVLRLVFVMAPSLTYALALTPIRYVDVLVGSALGLVPPLVLATLFFDTLLRWVGA